MSEHTKGKWEVKCVETTKGKQYYISATGKEMIIDCGYIIDVPEAEANARLIAKAPEMLEMLKLAEKVIDQFWDYMELSSSDGLDEFNDWEEKIPQLLAEIKGK